ncbi:MAG: hydrogenase maturation nickel metallochaperone HypA [Rhodospirillaceae bacterium]|nr:hydrogenase maturation nickel metallochaperone HypA [Rhodospirillaceae bacterium]MCY4066927.1 hydrogenase maturation nickel metallochaperone HypA [Rhodospirillaceae bacterium]
MHELALARSLIELVDDHATRQGARRVRRIHVRLGQLSAMTRALYFCFASAARGTSCEGAVLEIEEVPLTVRCPFCETTKTPTGRYSFRCPDCGMPTPEVVTGREMQLMSIELGFANSGTGTGAAAGPGSCGG